MQKTTQLANELWPLLLPRVAAMLAGSGAGAGGAGGAGGGVGLHELGGAQHIGGLRDDQAPQFLKLDGSRALTGDLPVNTGVKIDGVDISAHVADPNAHHARQHSIIGSADHTVTGSQWQVVGLTATNTLGLLTPSSNPGAASALLRTDDTGTVRLKQVELGAAMTLYSDGNVANGPDIAFSGAGLLSADDSIYFVADDTNTGVGAFVFLKGAPNSSGAELMRLTNSGRLGIGNNNPTYALDVTGEARATTALRTATAYATTKVQTPLIDTAAGDLQISPFSGITNLSDLRASTRLRTPLLDTASGDLTINPASRTLFADDKQIRSQTHTAGFLGTGFSISWPLSGKAHLDIRSAYMEELEVTAFQADVMRLRVAEDFLGQSMGQTSRAFTTPAAIGSTVRVYFENNPSFAGQIFLDNEWVMFQVIQRGAGLLNVQVWGKVDSYLNEGNGEQSWRFRLQSGPTGLVVNKSSIALSFGLSGSGYIHSNVLRNQNGPWTRYATWSGADPFTPANRRVHAQSGNLNGLVDITTNRYGTAAGNNLALTPTTGFSGFTADDTGGLRLFNTAIDLYRAGVQTVDWQPDGSLWIGTSADKKFEFNAASGQVRIANSLLIGNGLGFATDALLYCGFDAGDPRFGESGDATGHLGQPATLVGKPTFRPGKFGAALEVSAGTTNLITNSSFEADTVGAAPSGWASYSYAGSGGAVLGSRLVSDATSFDGRQCVRIAKEDGTGQTPPTLPWARIGIRYTVACTPGQLYSISARIWLGALTNPVAGQNNAVLWVQEVGGTGTYSTTGTAGQNGWQELRTTLTPATTSFYVYVWLANCDVGEMYVDAVQAVAGPQRPYWPGENGVRPVSGVQYGPLVGFDWQKFTISTWVRSADVRSAYGSYQRLWGLGGGNNYIDLLWYPNGQICAFYIAQTADGTGNVSTRVDRISSPITDAEWHHIAVVVDYPTITFYVDGTTLPESTKTLPRPGVGVPSSLKLGRGSAGTHPFDGALDDFAIIPRPLAASEIAQIAQGSAPIRALAAPSSLLLTNVSVTDGLSNTIQAHGGGIFGSRGASASFALLNDTRSAWGGFSSLEAGDLVLGHNKAGSAAIFFDQSAGTFGFYGGGVGAPQVTINATGEMRAGGGVTAVAADGFGMARYTTEAGTPIAGTESKAALAWWDNINIRTGTPLARIYAGRSSAGSGAVPSLSVEVDAANADAKSRPSLWLVGKGGGLPSMLWVVGVNQVIGIPGLFASRNTTTDAETLQLTGRTILKATLERDAAAATVDLGTSGSPFRTLYVGSIVADTITGGTSIGGAVWQNDAGDMYIKSSTGTDTGTRTLYIANPGNGVMNLDVEGSILVGGNVDGVKISTFKGLYDAHVLNANAHHAQSHSYDSTDHTGLLSWSKLNKAGSSLADLETRSHASLTGIGANDHHNQQHTLDGSDHIGSLSWSKVNKTGASLADLPTRNYSDLAARGHVLATTTGLGTDHTVSGLTAGQVLRASSATGAAFAQLQHGDLGGVGANDHHNQQHALAGSDHTASGLTPGWVLRATGATAFAWQQLAHSDLSGLTTGDPHTQYALRTRQVASGNGLIGGGDLSVDRTLSVKADDGISVTASGVAVDATVARSTWNVIAGAGLTGGGTLAAAGITLNVGAGTLITVNADKIDLSAGTAQYQVISTGESPFTPAYTPLSSFAGDALGFSSGKFHVLPGEGLEIETDAIGLKTSVAGNGLTYTAGVLAIGAGTLITVNATNVALSVGTAQYQVIATGASPYTPAYTPLSSFAGDALGFSSGQFHVLPGEGLEIETDAIGLKASVAGNGLTYTTGVLAVGAGQGITVNADDVALTTPGSLSVSTTNSASGSHTHAIATSSNPGATASILATTSSGALTLLHLNIPVTGDLYMDGVLDFGANTLYEDGSYLNVTGTKDVKFTQTVRGTGWSMTAAGGLSATAGAFAGSVDITSGGNLYVAGSIGGASGVLKTVGDRVGILCVPDPQFALDVAGVARAAYFVGKQAIQLDNAKLIAHYDGPEQGTSGDLNGHMGQVGTATGGVTFVRSKFLKAVQVAEATTNLVTNPSFETGTSGWMFYNGSGTASFARSAESAYAGQYSLKATSTTTGAYDYAYHAVAGLLPSTQYVVSVWVNVTQFNGGAPLNRGLVAWDSDNQGATLQTATVTGATNGWVRLSVIVTTTATAGSHTIDITLYAPNGTLYWDAVQCEQKAYPTPYCDGSLGGYSASGVPDGSGHAWTGTAHASTSTRTAGVVTYSTDGNIDQNQWTVMAWVNPSRMAGAQEILCISGTTAGYIILRMAAGKPQAYGGTNPVTAPEAIAAETWTHLAATYDGTTLRLYVNGAQVTSGAASGFSGMPAAMYIGRSSFATGWFNGMIDDLVILGSAAPAGKILSIYQSDAPVFATTSIYAFRATPNGLVSGDENGLWMRDSVGNGVLGVYGGKAATYSWGGQTLEVGDLLIGRGTNYVLWDNSAATLTFSGNGAGLTAINGGNIQTGTVTAAQIAAGTITASLLNFTPVTSTNVVASINATAEGIRIGGNRIQIDGNVTFAAGYNPTTKITAGGAAADINTNTTTIDGGKITTGSILANKLAVTAGGDNLIANSSFEADTDSNGLADSWLSYNNSSALQPSTLTRVTGRLSSTYAQRVSWSVANTTSKGVCAPMIGAQKAGIWYCVSWWALTNTDTPVGTDVLWNGTAPANVEWILQPTPQNGVWQRWAKRVRWTADNTSDVFLSITYGSPRTGSVDFDDVMVHEGDVLQNYMPRTSEILPGTILASYLSVSTLSAISADLGAVTAGSIVVTTGSDKLWLNDSGDGGLALGGTTKAAAPFRVTAAGALTATSADITGSIKATSGYIGGTTDGWAVASKTLSSTNIKLQSGTADARLEVGSTGTAIGGVAAGSAAADVVFWAGSTYDNRSLAATPFRVTLGGTLTAASADITGSIKATSGYIGGTTDGWAVASKTLSSTNIKLQSGTSDARLEVGSAGAYIGGVAAGSAVTDVVFWAGSTYSNRAQTTTPLRITLGGKLYATNADLTGNLAAANGDVVISDNGISIKGVLGTDFVSDQKSYRFTDASGAILGGLYHLYSDSLNLSRVRLEANSIGKSKRSELELVAVGPAGTESTTFVRLGAGTDTGVATAAEMRVYGSGSAYIKAPSGLGLPSTLYAVDPVEFWNEGGSARQRVVAGSLYINTATYSGYALDANGQARIRDHLTEDGAIYLKANTAANISGLTGYGALFWSGTDLLLRTPNGMYKVTLTTVG